MEELTREEAIRRHRLMWNWLADESEKGKLVTKEDAFNHFGWDIHDVLSSCWCCEWTYIEWRRNKELCIDFRSRCCLCPLDWSNGNGKKEIVDADCAIIRIHDRWEYSGLYILWWSETFMKKDPTEASKLARIIANLPEKKEVKEHD